MKNILRLSLAILILNIGTSAQFIEKSLHPIVQKVKEKSLYADQVNWKEVNTHFVELIKGKESVQAMKAGLQYLINSLGDKHGSFRSTKDHSIIVHYTGEIKEVDNRNPHFVNTVINDISMTFSYKKLQNQIGYLKVVGIGRGNIKSQSDLIRNGLINLKKQGVNKWILDLRYNGGGNMEPMLSGLAPLLGDNYIGGAVNNQNIITRKYYTKNGQFNNNGRVVCQMDNNPIISSDEKIAVLLSRYTISSGELVGVAFKGRENTRFFGEKTAGYTTGNCYEYVTDDLILTISEDVFIDRNKIKYSQRVDVDEAIEFEHNTSLENDNQVDFASKWLNK